MLDVRNQGTRQPVLGAPYFRGLFFRTSWAFFFFRGLLFVEKKRWNSIVFFNGTLKFGFYWGFTPVILHIFLYSSFAHSNSFLSGFRHAHFGPRSSKSLVQSSFLQKDNTGFPASTDFVNVLSGLFFGDYRQISETRTATSASFQKYGAALRKLRRRARAVHPCEDKIVRRRRMSKQATCALQKLSFEALTMSNKN